MPDDASPTASAPAPHGGQPVVTSGAPRGGTEVVVVALHGRGATAQGVVNLLDPIYRHGLTFLAPDAHRSRWYPYAADAPRESNEPDFGSAVAVVDALVSHATDAYDVPRERVVLAGFSQGATVAIEYALANPRRYGGVVALSGARLPGDHSAHSDGDFERTPVLLGVGRDDPHVPVKRVRDTATAFRDRNADVTLETYDGVGHEVVDDEFERIDAILDRLIAD